MPNILVVDDNSGVRMGMLVSLQQAGYSVQEAEDGEMAIQKATKEKFDLAIVDLILPDMDGIALYEQIRKISSEMRLFIITAYPYIPEVEKARKLNLDIMKKPFGMQEVVRKVKEILEEKLEIRKRKEIRREIGN